MSAKEVQPRTCSGHSLEAGESLIGSASQVLRYVLLEYEGAWGGKAFEESALTPAVKDHLEAYTRSDPFARVLLIRRPQRRRTAGFQLFLAATELPDPALYAWQLESYEALLDLDFAALFDGSDAASSHRVTDPLFLVCTHGRRDACCARLGAPVYLALSQELAGAEPALAWESSHVGGHRFAANLFVLPDGLLFGRVDPGRALEIAAAARAKQVLLSNLRGRCSLSPAAQAAELALRQNSANLASDAFILHRQIAVNDSAWQIEFEELVSGKLHTLKVLRQKSSVLVFESCLLNKTLSSIHYEVEYGGSYIFEK